MSLLLRFRGQGGFFQLVRLFESSDSSKQRNLFELVSKEDPGWAHLLKIKALSLHRILAWPPEILHLIWPHVPSSLAATLWQKAQGTDRLRLEMSMPHAYLKLVRKECEEIRSIDESEYLIAGLRLVCLVRDLDSGGQISLAEVDPSLALDPEILGATQMLKRAA